MMDKEVFILAGADALHSICGAPRNAAHHSIFPDPPCGGGLLAEFLGGREGHGVMLEEPSRRLVGVWISFAAL